MSQDRPVKKGLARQFLRWIYRGRNHHPFIGDMEELYSDICRRDGERKASFWFWRQLLTSLPHLWIDIVRWRGCMLRNYLLIGIRTIMKQKTFSLINIFGLAIGIAIFILAALFFAFNRSFDSFHPGSDRVYGVVQVHFSGNKGEQYNAVVPAPFTENMISSFPGIESVARFSKYPRAVLGVGERKFYESQIFFVDPGFLRFFSFPLATGNPESALDRLNSIVLTRHMAEKYFAGENPVGRQISLGGETDLTVTGVLEEMPCNTSFHFDFLVSLETGRGLTDWLDNWKVNSQQLFLRLEEGLDPGLLEAQFPEFLQRHYETASPQAPQRMFLLPLSEFRTRSDSLDLRSYLGWAFPYEITIFFLILGMVVMLAVCINFMSLSAARQQNRSKEVGVRKVIGASRAELIHQFLGESVLQAVFSLPVGIVLFHLLKPVFINYMGQRMDLSLGHYPHLIFWLLGVTLLVGLFVGSYPAFYLSSFQPGRVIKSLQSSRSGRIGFRKILVVGQFVLAIVLIVLTGATVKQTAYLEDLDFGYNREGVLVLPVNDRVRSDWQLFRDKIDQHNEVIQISGSSHMVVNSSPRRQVIPQGYLDSDTWSMDVYSVDSDFTALMDIELLKGRDFGLEYENKNRLIINETAAKQLRWTDPIGKEIQIDGQRMVIVGLTRDFIFNEVHFGMRPTLLLYSPGDIRFMFIRYRGDNVSQQLSDFIRQTWRRIYPELPLELDKLQNEFFDHYRYIPQMAQLFALIGAFTIFISGFGLLGFAAFVTNRRIKEIGIRKVLGASLSGILILLYRPFFWLVLSANVAALPLSYLLVSKFLQWAWSYHSPPGAAIYSLAASLTVLTTVLAVSFQTVRAGRSNPVDSLKVE